MNHTVGDRNVGAKNSCGRSTASQKVSRRIANIGNVMTSASDEATSNLDPKGIRNCAVQNLTVSSRGMEGIACDCRGCCYVERTRDKRLDP